LNFAQRYDLKSETLRRRVKAVLKPKDLNHGNQRFSNEEAIEIMRFLNKCGEEWDG